MNTYTINLSSNSSTYDKTYNEYELYDRTEVCLNLEQVYMKKTPLNVTITWETDNIDVYNNNIFETSRSKASQISIPPVFKTYKHIFYPSETSLYKKISIHVEVSYVNGDISTFEIPLKIRTNNILEEMENCELLNSNLLNGNSVEFHIKTKKSIVELIYDI